MNTFEELCHNISEQGKIKMSSPFQKSVWKTSLIRYIYAGKVTKHTNLRRATFLSGGQLLCSWKIFSQSFGRYAEDIMNGVTMPVCEIAYSHEGIRLFAELDYRLTYIPSMSVIENHIRIIHTLAKEMFSDSDITCHIARCDPKIKRKKNGDRMIATGIHIVFQYIVVNTETLRRFVLTADARITHDNPVYTNIVDDAVVHSQTATLRMLYAHKIENCSCSTFKTHRYSKNKQRYAYMLSRFTETVEKYDMDLKDNLFESSDDEFDTVQQSYCEDCFNGKIVQPSVYIPIWSLDKEAILSTTITSIDIAQQLQMMSITPIHMLKDNTTPLTEPCDLANITDIHAQTGSYRIFKSDKFRKKDLKLIDNPHIHRFITSILRNNLPTEFRHVVCSNVAKSKDNFMIHVKGRNSSFCPYKHDVHKTDRSFFVINTKRHILSVRCHNSECSKTLRKCDEYFLKKKKNKDIIEKLSSETIRLYKQFRIRLNPLCADYSKIIVPIPIPSIPEPDPIRPQTPAEDTQKLKFIYNNIL